MLVIYRLLINIIYFFSPIIFIYRIYKNKEDRLRYKEKLSIIKKKRPRGKLIWLHVSSVGELLSVIPILRKFESNKKIKNILVTSSTLSSSKVFLKQKKLKKTFHQFLPIDKVLLVKKFIDFWKPNLAIFVESEIWPNFILHIKERKIPLLLLNARITNRTFLRWNKINFFAKEIFNKFDLCLSQNRETGKYLKELGAKNIKNFGNLKFSSSKDNRFKESNNNLSKNFKSKKTWCAASTHRGEEIFCAKTHIELKKKIKNTVLILIPRHTDRTNEIKTDLEELNLKVHIHSNKNKTNKKFDVYLIDSYGETEKFYSISKSVFLGKSIEHHGGRSGQNPLEATREGCKVYHGPYVSNFQEIYSFLNKNGISKRIKTTNQLNKYLSSDLNSKQNNNKKIKNRLNKIGKIMLKNIYTEVKKFF